ncbi:MAG: glycosyltransferase [Pseudomonadota bacterium]
MPLAKRILFVTESFNIGGTESHLLALLPELKARGFEVAAFCFTEKGSRAGQLEDEAISVQAAPSLGADSGGGGKRSWRGPLRMVGGAAKLYGLTRRFKPSIVHFFLPAPYILGAPVSILAGVPKKIMSRRSLNDYQRNWPGAASAEHMLHARMDLLMGNARSITQELQQEGVADDKIRLIYNGVRSSPLNERRENVRKEMRDALGITDDALVITVIANLHPYKGHLDLIAALAEVSGDIPNNWKLLIVGQDSGNRAKVESAIDQASLHNHIQMLGARSDVPRILAATDIGALTPTRNEGLSNAILESMAAGLPLVVSDVGGNAEVVANGQTGLVVPPNDPQALGAALRDLMQDTGRRRAFGEAARARAKTNFSLSRQVDQYCEAYRELLDGS